MDLFSVLTFIGGIAMFLFGMQTMGEPLEKLAAGKMRATLERLTSNTGKGVLLGAGVTAVIQSSAATMVMVLGFVNSGVMRLQQAIGIIMGANIGTTITAWLLSLTGLDSSNFFIQLLKPSSFTPVLAIIGVIFYLFSKRDRRKDTGLVMLGFSVLIFGMEMMSGAVKPLADVPQFTQLLMLFQNPFFGVLVGAVMTAIMQSSSASVGILQALTVTGSVTYGAAIPIILGQNIGSCITSVIASVGAGKNAKRATAVHLSFNLIGTVLCLAVFYGLKAILDFTFVEFTIDAAGIAVVHSAFNIVCTVLFLPFTKQLEKLAYLIIPETPEQFDPIFIDKRFLSTPPIAVQRCRQLTVDMSSVCRVSLLNALKMVTEYDEAVAKEIREDESMLDRYEDRIGSYLIELSSRNVSVEDSHQISELLHTIGDFERIGDHALNILEAAEELQAKDMHFSGKALTQLSVITEAVSDITTLAISAFQMQDYALAGHVEPLEEVVDYLRAQLKGEHIRRLQNMECTIELGFVYSDLLTNYERVADHCSNIAACVIQTKESSMNMHEYLAGVKSSDNGEFRKLYEQGLKKYKLP